ncbi:unnamed protein product [Sphagnum troendelagicum]
MQARAKGIGTISTNATGSLVDLYAKRGSIKDAWRVFNKMPSQDVVIWNAMLGGCAMHGHGKEALKHFEQMCEGVQPDDIIFICPLSVCSHAGLVDEGMCCYASMVTDYMISVKLEHYTCMVNLLSCPGHLREAENMVMAMPCKQHVAAWMVLLDAYRIHGNVEMSNTYAGGGNRHLHENVEWQRKEKRGLEALLLATAVGGKCHKADEHVFHICAFSSKSKDGDGYR